MTKKIFYVSFMIAGIVLLIISIISSIIIAEKEISVDFTNFFIYFDFPLKFIVGAIACFTLAVTFLRAYQFDDNLKIINSNNRFNNYFKFKEEFEKHFLKSRFVSMLCPEYFKEPKQVINHLFISLYGTSINEFKFGVLEKPLRNCLSIQKKQSSYSLMIIYLW